MALSGSFSTKVGNGYRLQMEWTATQNIANNTSTITAILYWMSLSSTYNINSSGTKTAGINFDGGSWNTRSAASMADLNGNQKKEIHRAVLTLAHNTDGTRTFKLDGYFDLDLSLSGTSYGTISLPETSFTLNAIPRESTLTSGQSWVAGSSTYFGINRSSSSYTHEIKIEVYNGSYWVYVGNLPNLTTGFTWTPTVAQNTTFFDYISRNSPSFSQPTRITLITYDGTKEMGTSIVTGTITSPNASVATLPVDFNIGSNVTVNLSRGISASIHTLRFYVNDVLIHTRTQVPISYVWTPTQSEIDAMYAATGSVKSATSKVEVDTYYDGTALYKIRYTTTKTGTATVTEAGSNPTFSNFTYADTNATTYGVTLNDQYIVQGKSILKATITNANKAVAKNGATITKYIATVFGKSITYSAPFPTDIIFDFSTINATTNQNLSITAYDSRGLTTEVIKVVNVIPYSPPVLNTTATRTSGFLDETTLTLSGTMSKLTVASTDRNSLVAASTSYRSRVKNGTYGAPVTFTGQVINLPSYSASNRILSLASTSTWEIEVTVTDRLGSTKTVLTVGAGTPIMHIDDVKQAVSVGGFPSSSGGETFQVFGELYVSSKLKANAMEVTGTIDAKKLIANQGSLVMELKAGSSNHVYMGFYAESANQAKRSAYFGFGTNGSSEMTLSNEMTGGTLVFQITGTDIAFSFGSTKSLKFSNGTITNDVNNLTLKATSATGYVVIQSLNSLVYLQVATEARIVAPGTTGTFKPILASAFTVNSLRTSKTNIEPVGESALAKVCGTKIYTYHLKDELNVYDENYEVVGKKDPSKVKKKIGMILDEAPIETVSGEGIDVYGMTSILWKAVQELKRELNILKGDVSYGKN